MEQFIEYLEDTVASLYERNKSQTREKAVVTEKDQEAHDKAKSCVWCKSVFDSTELGKKVFDHDHLTGEYRGAACQRCNNKLRQDRNSLVVFFHNFQGEDSHALCLQGFEGEADWELKPVAQNPEKYMALSASRVVDTVGNRQVRFRVKFLDSYQHMSSSLAQLVENLVSDKDYSRLVHSLGMLSQYPALTPEDLACKGVFPYSYVSSFEKLREPALPPLSEWYDVLEEAVVTTQDEHNRACRMFAAFNCQDIFDYQLRYLELDCRLLADVYEEFRRLVKREDGFDPCHFLTISQLSYASALKWCGRKIGLIVDPEIYRDIEQCKRGGYSFVNKHHCVAQNKYANPSCTVPASEEVYLANIDENNLYGNALRYPLPTGNFEYLSTDEIDQLDFKNIPTDGDVGYFVVCDLHYPSHLHNTTQDFPLAPHTMEIQYEQLTEVSKALNREKNLIHNPLTTNPNKFLPSQKLVTTCYDKKKYVVHFVALKFYLQMGLQITKIHRVIKHSQSPLFRDYIDFNTNRRMAAVNEFEKNLYKQKNCSLYGKSLENKRNRCEIVLCTSPHQHVLAASKPKFRCSRVFSDDLVAAVMTKVNVELDSPIAIGAAVLDISKLIMYELVNVHLAKYQAEFNCKIEIVRGDTDSLFLQVTGVDLYATLYPRMAADGLLDTSNYPKNHPLFSNAYNAKLGCVKDEGKGEVFTEFILLRPKSYSMWCSSNDKLSKKTCKGIARRNVKKFTHQQYQEVYQSHREIITTCRRIQPIAHTCYNMEQRKRALSVVDDKRAWVTHNSSLPYGHHALLQSANKRRKLNDGSCL